MSKISIGSLEPITKLRKISLPCSCSQCSLSWEIEVSRKLWESLSYLVDVYIRGIYFRKKSFQQRKFSPKKKAVGNQEVSVWKINCRELSVSQDPKWMSTHMFQLKDLSGFEILKEWTNQTVPSSSDPIQCLQCSRSTDLGFFSWSPSHQAACVRPCGSFLVATVLKWFPTPAHNTEPLFQHKFAMILLAPTPKMRTQRWCPCAWKFCGLANQTENREVLFKQLAVGIYGASRFREVCNFGVCEWVWKIMLGKNFHACCRTNSSPEVPESQTMLEKRSARCKKIRFEHSKGGKRQNFVWWFFPEKKSDLESDQQVKCRTIKFDKT